jgi:hypothetical protein
MDHVVRVRSRDGSGGVGDAFDLAQQVAAVERGIGRLLLRPGQSGPGVGPGNEAAPVGLGRIVCRERRFDLERLHGDAG